MFDQPSLWTEIGYEVVGGQLAPGHDVRLARTSESSPVFLEDHSSVDDLVAFHIFDTEAEQAEWVAEQIQRNLEEDELRHDDIVVINTNPITTRRKLGIVRKALIERGIVSHLAGVDTSADVFFAPDRASITCTGVFRAKGNEAGMVYVINGQECESEGANLAQLRNRLFTAITRSKAWVRVCGVGSSMEDLREEFDSEKSNGFQLQFNYPTDEEREKMQIVHRDMSKAEAERVAERRSNLGDLIADLEEGRLYPEDLDDEMLSKLRGLLDK
jgi:superfamily I DNA and RNA helicase